MFLLLPTALAAVVLPALVAARLLAAGHAPDRRGPGPTAGAWSVPLAIGLGFVAGAVGLRGWPPWPPVESTAWLPYLALAATLLGLLEAARPGPPWTRWLDRLVLIGATLWLVPGRLSASDWAPTEGSSWPVSPTGAAWLAGLAVAMLAAWLNLEALARRMPGPALPLVLVLALIGAGVVMQRSHSATHNLLGIALAATLAAAMIVSWWAPALSLARGGVPVVVVVMAGILLDGYFFAADTPSSAAVLLLASAPAVAWVGRLGPIGRRAGWRAALACGAAALVPVALAILLSGRSAPEAEAAPEGGIDYSEIYKSIE